MHSFFFLTERKKITTTIKKTSCNRDIELKIRFRLNDGWLHLIWGMWKANSWSKHVQCESQLFFAFFIPFTNVSMVGHVSNTSTITIVHQYSNWFEWIKCWNLLFSNVHFDNESNCSYYWRIFNVCIESFPSKMHTKMSSTKFFCTNRAQNRFENLQWTAF